MPVVGAFDMRAITRNEIGTLVAKLDAKVSKGDLSAKSAKSVGQISKLFDDATNAKPASGLRCLETDPTAGVRGPDDDGSTKLLQFLYPSELETFLACEHVPRTWRRNVAIAIYLALRVGEQKALRWSSVNLDHGVATIEAKYDRQSATDKDGTKSGGGAHRPDPGRADPVAGDDAEGERGEGVRLRAAKPSRPRVRAPPLAQAGWR